MERVHVHTINPLALSNDEIYGMFDEATMGFTDGVLVRDLTETPYPGLGLGLGQVPWGFFPVPATWVGFLRVALHSSY